MALCINTSEDIKVELQRLGQSTPPVIKHLGIYLGVSIEQTIQEKIQQTDAKCIKHRILATTPPTDLLLRALLVHTAFIPIYNHVLMSLPHLQGVPIPLLSPEKASIFFVQFF